MNFNTVEPPPILEDFGHKIDMLKDTELGIAENM